MAGTDPVIGILIVLGIGLWIYLKYTKQSIGDLIKELRGKI
jgi:hypothetical protein